MSEFSAVDPQGEQGVRHAPEPGIQLDSATQLPSRSWSPLKRLFFRIAFLYFSFFILSFGNGTLISPIPFVGAWTNRIFAWPWRQLAVWAGIHLFHLTGLAARWHPTGSGDTALNWIQNGLLIFFALLGGLLWTAIAKLHGERRTEYSALYGWLRLVLRLTVAYFMALYGISKLYPLQMAPISIAILNEPLGRLSPMTLLWSLIGMNPVYESVCGAVEFLGGVFLLFRRTALFGALFSAFVLTNVVLYNFFFDVPVKLFSVNLLLAAVFLAGPDFSPLWGFFWTHRPAAPAGEWVPSCKRRGSRIAVRAIEIFVLLEILVAGPIFGGIGWRQVRIAARTPSPLIGAWHLDASQPASGAFITGDGLPATDFYIDTVIRAFTRSSDGELWRTALRMPKSGQYTLTIFQYGGKSASYIWRMPDPNHLALISTPPLGPKRGGKRQAPASGFTPATLTFTRTPIGGTYPLLDRGFHLINQWGLER